MGKATDELLKTHHLVNKVLEQFTVGAPRFTEVMKTLRRNLAAHAWFHDEIFLPALKNDPLIDKRFIEEINQEHKDLDHLLETLEGISLARTKALEAQVLQIRSVIEGHFRKEEKGLFPLAEMILSEDVLRKLGDDMEKRKMEVRDLAEKS